MEEDWDTLIILDGCRADVFERRCPFDGTFETRQSKGSATPEWLKKNFIDETYHDTVYLTANPFVTKIVPSGTFHDVIWLGDEKWDEDLGTVPPDVVCERLTAIRTTYPNKRIVAHFVQPHFPFIGDIGRQFDASKITMGQEVDTSGTPWSDLKFGRGSIDVFQVWEAYCENLDLAFEVLGDVIEQIEGRTVISSDHGNLIGERMSPIPIRGFGHPIGLYVPELVNVPWFIIEQGDRPTIESETPRRPSFDGDSGEQLKALGYR